MEVNKNFWVGFAVFVIAVSGIAVADTYISDTQFNTTAIVNASGAKIDGTINATDWTNASILGSQISSYQANTTAEMSIACNSTGIDKWDALDTPTAIWRAGNTSTEIQAVIETGNLTLSDFLNLTPSDAPGACDTTSEAAVYYDQSLNTICFCNTTDWVAVNGTVTC